jgi:uncharacterized protein with FMN-binding domain
LAVKKCHRRIVFFSIRDAIGPTFYNRHVATSTRRRSGTRVGNSLVALGSAAVLAVYTAGYARTRAAAAQLDAADRQRPVLPAAPPASAAPLAHLDVAPAPISTPVSPASRAPARAPAKPRATLAPAREWSTKPAPLVTPTAPVVPDREVVDTTPTPAPTPTPARPPAGMYIDGSYSGWGRSRHGDIQATVRIEDGKIVYAAISVCATRYPCDVIDKLPAQVLARQSPEVDVVAGATESTNAFYYAVVEALNKAK